MGALRIAMLVLLASIACRQIGGASALAGVGTSSPPPPKIGIGHPTVPTIDAGQPAPPPPQAVADQFPPSASGQSAPPPPFGGQGPPPPINDQFPPVAAYWIDFDPETGAAWWTIEYEWEFPLYEVISVELSEVFFDRISTVPGRPAPGWTPISCATHASASCTAMGSTAAPCWAVVVYLWTALGIKQDCWFRCDWGDGCPPPPNPQQYLAMGILGASCAARRRRRG